MKTLIETAHALNILHPFLGRVQKQVLGQAARYGEEKQFFRDKLCDLASRVEAMPKTYEQDGKGDSAIASLHYFAGGQANWWITEKDAETPDEPGQHQAFGLADLFQDGGELGYISIAEIIANGGELDLYFNPKTLAEVKQDRASFSECEVQS